MPVYDAAKDHPGGLARRLATLRRGQEENRRIRAGNVGDPTPPAEDVEPGVLTRALLEEQQ